MRRFGGAVAFLASSSVSLFGFGTGSSGLPAVSAIVDVPVRVSGAIEVSFHGDPAAGCAARGVCAVSGSVSWTPVDAAQFLLSVGRQRGRSVYSGSLGFESLAPTNLGSGGLTSARVSGPATSCADAVENGNEIPLRIAGGQVTVDLAGGSGPILQDRCGGPTAGDLSPALTRVSLPLHQLLSGHRTITFPASGGFAGGGFAGQVTSSLVLTLGAPSRQSLRITVPRRYRTTAEQLEAVYGLRLRGAATERFGGSADPSVCGPLGACGLTGTLTLAPDVRSGQATISATTSGRRRPAADYLTALGIGHGGRTHGVSVSGSGLWPGGGTVSVAEQSGGGSCTDASSLGSGGLVILATGKAIRVLYFPGLPLGGLPGGITDRCPGPLVTTGTGFDGAVPISAFAHRVVTIVLRHAADPGDDGYGVTATSTVTVTLTRRRIVRSSYSYFVSSGSSSSGWATGSFFAG